MLSFENSRESWTLGRVFSILMTESSLILAIPYSTLPGVIPPGRVQFKNKMKTVECNSE